MSPQLVDFDADGHMDILAGTFDGTVFLVRGSADGYQPFERVVDRDGRNVQLANFWSRETESWEVGDRSPEGAKNPEDHCIAASAVDWDGDGDLDLVLGAKGGRLYVQENLGSRREPSFAPFNAPIVTSAGPDVPASATQIREGEHLTVPGGCTAPRVVDWNGDGLFDLVCGSFAGGVFCYLNRGTATEPAFGAPIALLHNAVDRTERTGAPTRGTYADPVDWDGDGDLDLLLGGYVEVTPEQRELDAAEEARADALATELVGVEKRLDELLDSSEWSEDGTLPEEHQEEFEALLARRQAIRAELDGLRPRAREVGRVFVLERL